ncbi:hypothetical protein ON010_g5596 [Phytophthora cinnamomi]|nr:hypothetical protein ON010_g5596 [Phytophthora cinnamomi]
MASRTFANWCRVLPRQPMWQQRRCCYGTRVTVHLTPSSRTKGSHFRDEVVQHLSARLKAEQNLTPVYSPWLNGTVERLNKDILQVFRALLMKYALGKHEWPYLLPAVQANLNNHTPVQSLAGRAPIEVFTGLPASSALDAIVVPASSSANESVIELDNIDALLDRLRKSLHEIHREVADVKDRKRIQDMRSHKGSPVNLDVGDFVLWLRIDQRLPNNKLLGQWVGPVKVSSALPHSFTIEHLVTGRVYNVHASRLKFYADADVDTSEELLELVSSQGMVLGVEGFREHRFNQLLGRWELLVSWVGLQATKNSWEPPDTMLQGVPEKVRNYAAASGDDDLLRQLE